MNALLIFSHQLFKIKMEPKYTLEYSRSIYNRTLDWYKSAETKAQIILTLNGVFIGFIGSNVFLNQDNLISRGSIGQINLLIIMVMLVSIVGSIIFALLCVKSRFSKLDLEKNSKRNTKGEIEYDKNLFFFFDHLRRLDPKLVIDQIKDFKYDDEINVLISGLIILSKNVRRKHRYVNISFMLFGLGLIMFTISLGIFIMKNN